MQLPFNAGFSRNRISTEVAPTSDTSTSQDLWGYTTCQSPLRSFTSMGVCKSFPTETTAMASLRQEIYPEGNQKASIATFIDHPYDLHCNPDNRPPYIWTFAGSLIVTLREASLLAFAREARARALHFEGCNPFKGSQSEPKTYPCKFGV